MINNPSQLSGLRSPFEILHLPTANRHHLSRVGSGPRHDIVVSREGQHCVLPWVQMCKSAFGLCKGAKVA